VGENLKVNSRGGNYIMHGRCKKFMKVKVKKVKFHPRTGHEGPEGKEWYRATF
jgi:hypothetical protein